MSAPVRVSSRLPEQPWDGISHIAPKLISGDAALVTAVVQLEVDSITTRVADGTSRATLAFHAIEVVDGDGEQAVLAVMRRTRDERQGRQQIPGIDPDVDPETGEIL